MNSRALTIALVLISLCVSYCCAQNPATAELLIEKLEDAAKKGASISMIKTDSSGNQNGSDFVCRGEYRLSKDFGSCMVTGDFHVAQGFNSEYAFMLRGHASESEPNTTQWHISKFSKTSDKDGYGRIVSMIRKSHSLFNRANVADSLTLLGLLKSKTIEIANQTRLESGAIRIQFVNTKDVKKEISKFDRQDEDFVKAVNDPNIDKANLSPPPTNRPTEILEMTCIIEPAHGYLLSRLELKSGHRRHGKHSEMEYLGVAEGFKKLGSIWYPRTFEFSRVAGMIKERSKSTITELTNGKPTLREPSSLNFYGVRSGSCAL